MGPEGGRSASAPVHSSRSLTRPVPARIFYSRSLIALGGSYYPGLPDGARLFSSSAPGPPHVPSEENRAIQAFGVWESRGYGRLTVIYREFPHCIPGWGQAGVRRPDLQAKEAATAICGVDARDMVTRPRPGPCALFPLYWGDSGAPDSDDDFCA